jgi:hypothetical protein
MASLNELMQHPIASRHPGTQIHERRSAAEILMGESVGADLRVCPELQAKSGEI